MKKFLGILMLAGLALGGCGNNDCEDAVDKLKECGLTDTSASSSGDCSGAAECSAKCINDASCADLKGETESTTYSNCVTACLK
jgi:hypothetical protein